ncbi:MAG: hypothetical protein JWP63_2995 [Candidatus Solibacter sp.]|nr:hypothetical protein [Candidatus Solibacter sp.]
MTIVATQRAGGTECESSLRTISEVHVCYRFTFTGGHPGSETVVR